MVWKGLQSHYVEFSLFAIKSPNTDSDQAIFGCSPSEITVVMMPGFIFFNQAHSPVSITSHKDGNDAL